MTWWTQRLPCGCVAHANGLLDPCNQHRQRGFIVRGGDGLYGSVVGGDFADNTPDEEDDAPAATDAQEDEDAG